MFYACYDTTTVSSSNIPGAYRHYAHRRIDDLFQMRNVAKNQYSVWSMITKMS